MPRIFRLQEHLQSWQEELVREDVILKGIPDPTAGLLWKEEESLRPITCSMHEEEKEVELEVLEVQETIQTVTETEGRCCMPCRFRCRDIDHALSFQLSVDNWLQFRYLCH